MTRLHERIALAVLLVGTAVAYIWGLDKAGWANSFYSAAVQAGTVSWKAMLFGSSDAANSITVDKPPASLWVMEVSTRIFGVNTWAMLVPQALLGVASVALLYATVRRRFGAGAGLLAGLLLAISPVAALMFRFNNPDALLVLLMIAAAWAMLRAVEDGRWRWLIACGAFVGFGFLTKQLAALLIVPGLALTYLIAGPPQLGKRVAQLFAAGLAMVVGAGWWLLIVELWPASSRPWIGGSQNNSILELTLGYNGLGRLNGNETGSVVPGGRAGAGGRFGDMPGFSGYAMGGGPGRMGGGRGGGMWGDPSIFRMFQPEQAGQIAWLLPAALIALVAGLVLRGRAPRTDGERASLIVWGSWLIVTGLTFSLMAGIFHSYYTVALAPAIAALVGIGAAMAWRYRSRAWVSVVAAIAIAATAITAWCILDQTPQWNSWLKWLIVAAAVTAVVGIAVGRTPALRDQRVVTGVVALGAVVTAVAGQVAYAAETIASPRQGSIVSAGPSSDRGPDGIGGHGRHHGGGGPSFLNGTKPGPELTATLLDDADDYTWVAATIGANSASRYQLATSKPVLPIGGFNGTDPSPTLAQFKKYVAQKKIHYFLTEPEGGFGIGDSGTSAEIRSWVKENFRSVEIDGISVYDLTSPPE